MIVLDVEIKKAILGRGETPIEGIEYCKGWRDFEGMGIACVCTYDINTHLSRAFRFDEEDQKHAFENYISGEPTAGFNTRRFDNTLLHHHGVDVEKIGGEHYDILEEIWIALGLNPDKFYPKTHGGWGLDAVCQATLGIAKTGHGALAPVWWQQGKQGKVIDYCLNDVWMEAQLLQWIIGNGWVTRDGKQKVAVKPPAIRVEEAHALSYPEPRIDVLAAYDKMGIPQRDARAVVNPELEVEIEADLPLPSGLGIIR